MSGNPTPPQPPAARKNAYDEFGTATRNLPPVAPVAVAIVLVAVVVAILVYVNRAKPAAQASIDGVYFSQPAGMPSPMILIAVTLRNTSDKTLYIKNISAAAARDYERYLTAYPDLQGHGRPLEVEMKIPPGAVQQGTVLISPSVTKEQFDARKDTTVTIEPYDQRLLDLHEKSPAAK
jgi:hypothetical protein